MTIVSQIRKIVQIFHKFEGTDFIYDNSFNIKT